jgi:uncharacterized protein YbaR (Trm112 family)
MKESLMDILCCPVCKGDLKLEVIERDEKEIIKGSLYCATCKVNYEIEDGIPNLLPKSSERR